MKLNDIQKHTHTGLSLHEGYEYLLHYFVHMKLIKHTHTHTHTQQKDRHISKVLAFEDFYFKGK